MSIVQTSAISLLLALLAFGMKEAGVKGHGFVLLFSGVWLLIPILYRIVDLKDELVALSGVGESLPMTGAILKILGVGYLVHMAAEGCRESGAPALAAKLELCGKLEILLLCLPYIRELLAVAIGAIS